MAKTKKKRRCGGYQILEARNGWKTRQAGRSQRWDWPVVPLLCWQNLNLSSGKVKPGVCRSVQFVQPLVAAGSGCWIPGKLHKIYMKKRKTTNTLPTSLEKTLHLSVSVPSCAEHRIPFGEHQPGQEREYTAAGGWGVLQYLIPQDTCPWEVPALNTHSTHVHHSKWPKQSNEAVTMPEAEHYSKL